MKHFMLARVSLLIAAAWAALTGVPTLHGADNSEHFPEPNWPLDTVWEQSGSSRGATAAYEAWLKERAGDSWASIVIRNGNIIYEGAGPHGSIMEKTHCGSIRKVLQSTVLGAALYQGKLKNIDEDAMPYWKDPYRTPYSNDRVITFRQFAQYHDRWDDPEPPGTYHYSNAGATAAGACIAGLFLEVRGPRPVGIAEVVRREVMTKVHADWELTYLDQDFTSNSSDPGPQLFFRSSAYELAKLGYLWLHHGRWGNQRIFSEDYYRDATTDWSPNTGDPRFGNWGHYGYWWFVNDDQVWMPGVPKDAFYVVGNGMPKRATVLMVIPSLNAVAVLAMERLSDDGKWDVIQNSRVPRNDGPRLWGTELVKLCEK
jgi:CubicO group peptidase (beta-lactamase class C family)